MPNHLHKKNSSKTLKRRRFLGLSMLGTASLFGLTTINLTSCSKTEELFPQPLSSKRSSKSINHFPAIVIGTGYGGAVSALRLAEAGVSTLMLEMGKLWDTPGTDGNIFSKMTSPDKRSMWLRSRTDMPISRFLGLNVVNQSIEKHTGVLDRMDFPNMAVYVGRGVGGGSIVNGGAAVRPRMDYLQESLPDVEVAELYSNYFPLAEQMLGVNEIDEDFENNSPYYRFTKVAKKHARRAGFKTSSIPNVYDFQYMEQEAAGEVPQSALAGEVIFGNNHGKGSLDKNYLADALGTEQVTLKVLHRVDTIEQNEDDTYTLEVSVLNEQGEVIRTEIFTCNYLVMGAGSVGTTQLLVKARATGKLPNIDATVGTEWGSNGNIMTARANHIWDRTGAQQSTIPVVAIDNWDDPQYPSFAEIAPLPMGIENWISLYLNIAKTSERGYFEYNPASDRAELVWGANQSAEAVTATKHLFDSINRRNFTIYRNDLFGDGKQFADDFTYHPLGGCPLGAATDGYGRVKNYNNFYINDGSLLPGNLGVNPMLTITALAERNIARIIAEDGIGET